VSVNPAPSCSLSGQLVAAGRTTGGVWPAAPMALEGVTVKWGRGGPLEQPTPATATVRLFDPTGVWAAGADLIGAPLELSWAAAGTTRRYFTGRVGGVAVEPHAAMLDNVRTDGALVTLSCTSLLADLANRLPAETSWPAETLAARRARIATLAAGPVASIATRPAWDSAPLAALDPSKTSCLDLLKGIFDACGADRYTYDPDTRAVGYLTRRTYPDPAGLVRFTADAARPGAYLTAPGGAVDGGRVAMSGAAHRDVASRLTRVVLTYTTGTTTAQVTVPLSGVDESLVGVRAASVTTGHTDPAQAAAAAADLAALAGGEATGWALDAMQWKPGTAGFDSLAQATRLIGGTETADVYLLQRTWLSALGIRPVFGVMGGQITYTGGAWQVQWTNAPIAAGAQPYTLTWDHIDDGTPGNTLVWDDEPGPGTVDDSVTYDDLAFACYGLGVTTIPTDGA
jgi:hypothetical protein